MKELIETLAEYPVAGTVVIIAVLMIIDEMCSTIVKLVKR